MAANEKPPSTSSFATVSFHRRDTLRFVQFPDTIYREVRSVLLSAWTPGLQAEKVYGESYEYRFKDTPFGGLGDAEGVASRRLVRDVLAFLYERGWVLITPITQTRFPGSKDTLIFRRRTVEFATLPPVDWLVVALHGPGRLRLIYDGNPARGTEMIVKNSGRLADANADVDIEAMAGKSSAAEAWQAVPRGLGTLVDSVKSALDDIKSPQTGDWEHDSFEFNLSDKPWRGHGENTVKARLVLLKLIETLDSFGWRSYGTIRHRNESDKIKKLDTWYFVRPKDWVVGSPFNDEAPLSLLD